MARRFNGNASNYFEALARAPVTSLPITIACWAKPNLNSITVNANTICISNTTDSSRVSLQVAGSTAGKPWRVTSTTSTGTQVFTAGSNAIDNVWQHAVGVIASTTSRTVYLNGISGSTDTTANDPSASSFTRTQLGLRRSPLSNPILDFVFNGDLADVCVWSVALTAREIQLLATGISPLQICPNKLVAYWPLNGQVGSGEASLISELDYANVYGTVPVVTDPIAELRKRAKPANIPLFRPYPRIYYVAGPNATWATPTSTEIMNGQLSGGGAATASWSESAPLQSTNPFNFSQPASPLTTGTKYRAAAVQKAGDSNVVSNVVVSDPFLAGAATLSNPEATEITGTSTKPKVTVSY